MRRPKSALAGCNHRDCSSQLSPFDDRFFAADSRLPRLIRRSARLRARQGVRQVGGGRRTTARVARTAEQSEVGARRMMFKAGNVTRNEAVGVAFRVSSGSTGPTIDSPDEAFARLVTRTGQ